jgi:hypothetical protein
MGPSLGRGEGGIRTEGAIFFRALTSKVLNFFLFFIPSPIHNSALQVETATQKKL